MAKKSFFHRWTANSQSPIRSIAWKLPNLSQKIIAKSFCPTFWQTFETEWKILQKSIWNSKKTIFWGRFGKQKILLWLCRPFLIRQRLTCPIQSTRKHFCTYFPIFRPIWRLSLHLIQQNLSAGPFNGPKFTLPQILQFFTPNLPLTLHFN